MAHKTQRYAILANRSYGLYAGVVGAVTPRADGTMMVEVTECRHVCRWYGKTGGMRWARATWAGTEHARWN